MSAKADPDPVDLLYSLGNDIKDHRSSNCAVPVLDNNSDDPLSFTCSSDLHVLDSVTQEVHPQQSVDVPNISGDEEIEFEANHDGEQIPPIQADPDPIMR